MENQTNIGTKESCTCLDCQTACQRKPGWFLPGEAEKAAQLAGVSLKEFFDDHLSVDYWEADENIFALSPAVVDGNPGDMFASDPRGQCVFYKDGLCSIHVAKPHECKISLHGEQVNQHFEVAQAWDTEESRKQIEELLGCKPVASGEFGILDMLGWRE